MRVGVRGDRSPRGNAWLRREPKGERRPAVQTVQFLTVLPLSEEVLTTGPRCERLSFEEARGATAGGVVGVDALTTGCGFSPRASQTRRPMSAIVLRTNPPGLEIP